MQLQSFAKWNFVVTWINYTAGFKRQPWPELCTVCNTNILSHMVMYRNFVPLCQYSSYMRKSATIVFCSEFATSEPHPIAADLRFTARHTWGAMRIIPYALPSCNKLSNWCQSWGLRGANHHGDCQHPTSILAIAMGRRWRAYLTLWSVRSNLLFGIAKPLSLVMCVCAKRLSIAVWNDESKTLVNNIGLNIL